MHRLNLSIEALRRLRSSTMSWRGEACAARWLEHARDAYGAADQAPDTQAHVGVLMTLHARKYRLMPHLARLAG